ncbi:IS3 family transposase [Paenibacillus hexagrammi]|uniref:IS3 family transposase n=1 Tax=Paenibacillus hexagrammi TaxID=2908839 RepID=A0ABY3SIX6_9BACL|nr:IS3 family transposase [Paenibacillus sp. YPD9-1]UJF33753.1 IS3 family transposase [Paenibacillus sp. YPD9-1]
MPKQRRTFTEEFKKQMVQLYENGKSRTSLVKEYDLTSSALDRWISQSQQSGAFTEKANRSPEEAELLALRKEIQQLRMENDIFKASRADHGTKVNVIRNNAHKYSVSAMCKVLGLPRSTYYYKSEPIDSEEEQQLEETILEIFRDSRSNYGTRKIKVELRKKKLFASRRRIGRIMKKYALVSTYTVAQYKPSKSDPNESPTSNQLKREFKQEEPCAVVVSDLTYVRVAGKWHYVCLFIDLYNREIIGFSSGPNKDALLVYRAVASLSVPLNRIKMFHTDRGGEFKNKLISEALQTFQITRSLSAKGCPYDNAVAEATFKIFKTEFANQVHFHTGQQLAVELYDYVHWFNHHRIHGTLGYLTPVQARKLPS